MQLPFIVLVMQDIMEHAASSTTLVQSALAAMQPHAAALDKHHSPARAGQAIMAAHVRTTTPAYHLHVQMALNVLHSTTSLTAVNALLAFMVQTASVITHALPTHV